MFCTKCGTELSEGARFCKRCGNPVGSGAVAVESKAGNPAVGKPALPESQRHGQESPLSEESLSGKEIPVGKRRKKKKELVTVLVILLVLLAAAGGFGIYYSAMHQGEDDTETDRRGDGEKTEESEETSKPGEESQEPVESAEPEVSAEAILQKYLDEELAAEYGYAALEPQARTFAMSEDTYTRWQEYNVWTGISGIADTETVDLDGDGLKELLIITVDEMNIGIQIYEVQGDAVVEQAEVSEERVGDLSLYEEAWTMLKGESETYLLFAQARMGIMADGYDANIKLYRYDGEKLYAAMEILQTAGGSSDFVYTAYRYDENGQALAEETIYDERGENGQMLDEAYCSARMKALFAEYGIPVREKATMFGDDHFLEKILASEADSEILTRLCMRAEYLDGQVAYYFGTRNRLTDGSYQDFLDGKKTARVKEDVSYLLDPGTDYTLGDILSEVKASYLEYSDRDEISWVEYAFLDCGNDGEQELAVRFTGLGIYYPGDDSDLTLILSDKSGALEIIYAFETWARSWTDVNYYGCIFSGGSSGAGDHPGFMSYIDGAGNVQNIYEYEDLGGWWTSYVSGDAYSQAFGNNDEHGFQVTIWKIDGSEYYEAIVDEAYGEQCRKFIELCQGEGKQFVDHEEIEILIGQRKEELGVRQEWIGGNGLRWNMISDMK